jgi:SAM-dependent methyltransferase
VRPIDRARAAARGLLSRRQRQLLHRLRRPALLGTLRRTTPLSDHWGSERGRPVDRYYIEQFLETHRSDVRGRGLEVKDASYLERLNSGLRSIDVLDVDVANSNATIIADLASAPEVPSDAFDCFILTQTLQLIYDAPAAVREVHRVLAPGGVLLLTVPGITRSLRGLPDYWRFTPMACERLFGDVFGRDRVTVHSYGNPLSAIAFLTGMAQEELSRRDLDAFDARYPVTIAVRAVKAGRSDRDAGAPVLRERRRMAAEDPEPYTARA